MPLIGSLGAAASRGFGQFLQKITAVLNTDAFFKYVTLLLTGNPPVSTFVTDASTNNLQVTINGDTKPSGFSPNENGYYSCYFDGTGDRILLSGSNLTLTGNFTVEAWVYIGSLATVRPILCIGDDRVGSGVLFSVNTTGKLLIYSSNASVLTGTGTSVVANTWTHVAFVRSGTTITGYVNGAIQGTATSSATFTGIASYIGMEFYNSATGAEFLGNISNLRVVDGTAVYTSAFTPSTTPLTAISGTTLLACQANRFIDNSSSPKAMTVIGQTYIAGFQPFTPDPSFATYGSTYFDGSGDTLNLAASTALLGAGDYTVEFFVYLPSAPTGGAYFTCFAYGASGSVLRCFLLDQSGTKLGIWVGTVNKVSFATTAPINQWAHIAITRSGTTNTAYINGVNVATFTDSTNFNTGQLYIASQTATNYLTGYISNFRIVVGTALYTSAFTPPTTQLTAVTNTSLLTCQTNQPVNNNVFLDSSSNNFPITRAGNTTQGSLNPYGDNWSNYFDGSGDYLSAAYNSAFNVAGNTFTIESWINITGSFATDSGSNKQGAIAVFGPATSGQGWEFFIDQTNNTLTFSAMGSNINKMMCSYTFVLGTWYHVAAVRNGSTNYLFVNGVSQTLTTNAYTGGSAASSTLNIGTALKFAGYNHYFIGYISNFRIVNGTALYTTNFTPPTTPLTAVSGTSLLTCQSNRLIDNSNNNFTITKTGDVSVQRFSPFAPVIQTPTSYSNYFDGSGDYLNFANNNAFALGSGDFTMESWVYCSSNAGNQAIMGLASSTGNASTSAFILYASITNKPTLLMAFSASYTALTGSQNLPTNAWTHIAAVRSGATVTLYMNGTSIGTASVSTSAFNASSASLAIGRTGDYNGEYLTGYISNARLVKGTAIYTANFTPSTTPLTAVSGTSLLTCQSPTFIDNSANNFSITATGNVVPRTQNPFGVTNNTDAPYTPATYGGSMYFDGTTDYLTLATNPQLGMGSGDFTVEFWTYQTSLVSYRQILDVVDGNSVGRLILWVDSAGTIYNLGQNGNSRNTSAAGAIVANTWVHVVLTRSSGTTKFYINGVQSGTNYTDSTNYTCTSGSVYIGINSDGGTYPYIGYLANFRMVKGTSLYKANFAPPVAPLQAVTNTSLLLLGSNGAVYDSAMLNNEETVGDAKVSTAVSKFGGSSMYFDGSDNLSIPLNTSYKIGTGDFTIEAWVYHTNSGSYAGYYYGGNSGLVLRRTDANKLEISQDAVASIAISTNTIPSNQWVHVAGTRSGTTVRIFINGVLEGTVTYSGNFAPTTAATVGSIASVAGYYMTGYIDDLRITNGYARYTQTFAVPTQPFPVQ